MQQIIEREFNNGNESVVVFLLGFLICFIIYVLKLIFSNRESIKATIDAWINDRIKKKELIELVYSSQKRLDEYAENRIRDREQSLAIQKQLTETQNAIIQQQNELVKSIAEIVKSSSARNEQIDLLKAANRELMAEKINEKYKYYISINGVPEDEIDEFTNLHIAYKGCGGNHSGDAKYEYCINHLPIIPVEKRLNFGD